MTAAMPAPFETDAFPYENLVVGVAYNSLALELANALEAIGTEYFSARLNDYRAARRTFKGLLLPADYRYFARECSYGAGRDVDAFTVIRLLQTASLKNDRSANFRTLGAGEALLRMDLGVFF